MCVYTVSLISVDSNLNANYIFVIVQILIADNV